jgi:hypothetical protein
MKHNFYWNQKSDGAKKEACHPRGYRTYALCPYLYNEIKKKKKKKKDREDMM